MFSQNSRRPRLARFVFGDSLFRNAHFVTQIGRARTLRLLPRRRACWKRGLSTSIATVSNLSFNSTTMRSAVFLPTPGIFVRPRQIVPANRRDQFFNAHPRQNFQRQRGPTPEAEINISK